MYQEATQPEFTLRHSHSRSQGFHAWNTQSPTSMSSPCFQDFEESLFSIFSTHILCGYMTHVSPDQVERITHWRWSGEMSLLPFPSEPMCYQMIFTLPLPLCCLIPSMPTKAGDPGIGVILASLLYKPWMFWIGKNGLPPDIIKTPNTEQKFLLLYITHTHTHGSAHSLISF